MAFERFGWGKNAVAVLIQNTILRGALLACTILFALQLLSAVAAAQSWTPVPTPSAATEITYFSIRTSNNEWYVSDRVKGFYKSTDKGSTWTLINGSIPIGSTTGGWSIQVNPNDGSLIANTVVSSGHTVFYRSTDDGNTWTVINPAGYTNSAAGTRTGCIMPLASGGNFVCGGFFGSNNTSEFYSSNNGVSGALGTYTPPVSSVYALVRNPVDGSFWTGTENGGTFRSTDGGAHWTQVWAFNSGLHNGNQYFITFDTSGNPIVSCQCGVFRGVGSGNGPYAWTNTFVNRNTSVGKGLFTDSAGSIYWGHNPDTNDTVTVYRSLDSGVTWARWDTGLPAGLQLGYMLENPNDGELYATITSEKTASGAVYRTAKSGSGSTSGGGGSTSGGSGGTSGGSGGTSGGSGGTSGGSGGTSGGSGGTSGGSGGTSGGSGGTSGGSGGTSGGSGGTSGGSGGTSGGSGSTSGGSGGTSGGSGGTSGGSGSTSGMEIQLNLPTAHVGAAYSGSASASGGIAPYHYSVVDGALPKGVVVDSITGSITGIPSTVGIFGFRIAAADSSGVRAAFYGHLYVLYPSRDTQGTGVVVTVSPTSGTIAPGQTQQFTSHVSGTTNTLVTWSASAGSISTAGLFTAPSATSTTTVTITAKSVANTNKKASVTMIVSPATAGSGISVAVSPLTASVSSGGTQQFSATVQGTSNTAVRWSASAGSISSAGLFTAPTVSSTTSVSVSATSVANSTKKSSAAVSVVPVSASLSITTSYLPGAQASTAYSYPLQASGGNVPYQWTVASGSLPPGFSLSSTGQLSGTTSQTGQFSFSAKVTDANNHSSSQPLSLSVAAQVSSGGGGTYDGPAQLPQILMQTAMANTPAPGTVTMVSAGGSLQTALNNANCGDTIELAAGATFPGKVVFPAKACDDLHWIIVRTSAPDTALPPEGTRMLPCYSGVSSLPGRPSFSCPGGVSHALASIVDQVPIGGESGPINFAAGANHYRLVGLEITRTVGNPDFRLAGGLGTADHIILDRVWLHGTPQDETATGFGLNGMSYAALIDSYADDFHCTAVVGVCTDAKVIGGGTSQTQDGPYKIVDNFLEASGENILFGGGAAAYTPADIEVRGNHFYKPLIWMKGQPGFVGGASGYPFMVKNHLELKNAQRVLIEGNIFEYSWGGFSQVGFSILLTPKNQAAAGGASICPLCAVMDVTIRYNKISHTGTGISMADVPDDNGGVAQAGERYSIHDITIDDVSASKYNGSGGMFQVINAWPANSLNNIRINHVTVFPDPISRFVALSNNAGDPAMYGFAMQNSIIGQNRFAIWNAGSSSGCAVSDMPLTELNTCFPGGYTFASNAIIDGAQYYSLVNWPAGNYFPASASTIGFVNFSGGNGGDYHLLPGSPYKNAGTDGKDLGADIDAILTATANAN